MAEKQLVISLAELSRVEVVCPRCKSSISFAASESGPFPTKCSVCGETLAVGISNIGTAWKEFLREAKAAKIQFRISL